MKEAVGRNLISKLRDNSVAPDGLHHFDMTNAAIGPKDLKAISDAIKGNFQAIESGLAPLLSIELAGNSLCTFVKLLYINQTPCFLFIYYCRRS